MTCEDVWGQVGSKELSGAGWRGRWWLAICGAARGQTRFSCFFAKREYRTNAGYSTGSNNRHLSDGTYNYTYDAEGNRTVRTEIATGHVTEYEWDHRNRLVSVTERDSDIGPATQIVQHTYDYLNRWVALAVDPDGDGPLDFDDTYFIYDGTPGSVSLDRAAVGLDEIGQIVLQFDDAGDLTNRYLWGQAVDQILADEQIDDVTVEGNVLWALTDHLNSVRDLAEYDPQSDLTTIANHIVYNAFGRVTSETNPAVDHLFGYTGRAQDDSTGLQNNLNRWYDAEVGQWLSQDPISFAGGDTNLRRYVGNSATHSTDPTGLAWWNLWICDVGAALGERIGNGVSAVFNNSYDLDLKLASLRQKALVRDLASPESTINGSQAAAVRNGVLKNGLTEAGDIAYRVADGAAASVELGTAVTGVIKIGAGILRSVRATGLAPKRIPGVGAQAVTPEGYGMGKGVAGKHPALMVDGEVYVHHHHLAAQELAGTPPMPADLYGFVELDDLGRVISAHWVPVGH